MNEYRHQDGGIVKIFPNALGTRLLFVDSQLAVYLYNPVNDQARLPPPLPSALQRERERERDSRE